MTVNGADAVTKMIVAADSPYPLSFDGSTMRFQLALFAMMSLTIMGGIIFSWMSRELWRGRREAFPWEPLFAVRVIFWVCALQALLRCGPEAAYMIYYREGSAAMLAQILFVKRWLDALSLLPGLSWMTLVWMFYTPMCSQLVRMSREAPVAPRISKSKLARFFLALSITFVISLLIAVGKK